MSMRHIKWYTGSIVYTNAYYAELQPNQLHFSLYRGLKYVKDDWLDLLLEEDGKCANECIMYIQPDYKNIALLQYSFSILFSEVI